MDGGISVIVVSVGGVFHLAHQVIFKLFVNPRAHVTVISEMVRYVFDRSDTKQV